MVFGAFEVTFVPLQVGFVTIINNLNLSTIPKKMIVE
jgi:hypothetical protein